MATMGLQAAVNSAIDCRAAFALSHVSKTVSKRKAIKLFDIPESNGSNNVDSITMLPGKTFALRKLPVLIGQT
jgi:hypothetical protein